MDRQDDADRGPGDADAGLGHAIYRLAARIFPICRSITGDGVRQTLHCLRELVDIELHEVPSGTQVLDWTVPREWRLRDAFIADAAGNRIVDLARSNLHVMSYSTAVDAVMPLAALKEHVFTLPEQPDLVPYRTSYYAEQWGFCMSHRQLAGLRDGHYRAMIDAELVQGSLTYGEHVVRGASEEEVLLSTHICHPSLANDNCSGLALLAHLARQMSRRRTRYTYRFLFVPGTIGAIAWLARNEERTRRIRHGLVVSCVGDGAGPVYKRSRRGDATIDRVMAHLLKDAGPAARMVDYSPYGYDERQYCSPGFDLPVGLFQRGQFGMFPEYHTSADNLDFIRPHHLAESFALIDAAIDMLERDRRLINLFPKGEPQLGRRGLYDAVGGGKEAPAMRMAFLWLLNLADGQHTLLDIAERSQIGFGLLAAAAGLLEQHGLLAEIGSGGRSAGLWTAAETRVRRRSLSPIA